MVYKYKRGFSIMVITAIILVTVIICAVLLGGYVEKKMQDLIDDQPSEIDLSDIDNGSYTGGFSSFPVYVEVLVTIDKHKITGITILKHRTGKGGPAEDIINDVIREQTLGVDAVSGATYSSIVILKAIEAAIESGR